MKTAQDGTHALDSQSTRHLARLLDLTLVAFFVWHAWYLLRSPLTYAPDDALFYYQIGFNASHGLGFRFSDMTPTNGFHPLWLGLCTVLGLFCNTKLQLLTVGTLAVITLNGLTALLLRKFLRQECGAALGTAGTLMAVPYLFFVAHGMEGSLAACLFTTLLIVTRGFLLQPKPTSFLAGGALCGLVVAARLDLVFFVAPIAGLLAWTFLRSTKVSLAMLRWFALTAAVGIAPVATFLAINSIYLGDPRPISGILKFAASRGVGSFQIFNGIVIAYFALGLLGAAAAFFRKSAGTTVFIAATGGGIAFIGYLLASNHAEVGAWYFMLFAVTGAVGFSLACEAFHSRWIHSPAWSAKALHLLGFAAAAASGFLMVRYGRRATIPQETYTASTSLGESARREHIHRVFAFDRPGELAFLDGLSVVAADGLTTNLPFQREFAARGFDDFLKRNAIDAVVLPKIGGAYGPTFCDDTYLSAIRFTCSTSNGQASSGMKVTAIEVFSRLTGASLGKLDLQNARRVEFSPHRELDMVLLDPHSAR